MTKKYLVSGAIAIFLLIAVCIISTPAPTQDAGGERTGQMTLVNKATSTELNIAGKLVDVGDYKNCVITTFVENASLMEANDLYTFKFQGSSMDDTPNFKSAATSSLVMASTTAPTYVTFSSGNFWDYIPVTNIGNSTSIKAGDATSTLSQDIVNRYSIDDDNVRWLGIELTVASTTEAAYATTTFSAVVNCDNN